MKTITVFTPTYNRAHCLPQVYESLVRQTNRDFLWLIIDDGSSDNTKELVDVWMREAKVEIEYVFKPNGGMHTGHNAAYQRVRTELNVCVDSDDFMPDDAIEKILTIWNLHKNDPKIAGIIGLDAFKDGKIVGTSFPENLKRVKYGHLKSMKVYGDKKFVYRTDVIRQYPEYPVFEGERFVPLNYKYLLIDHQYDMVATNDVLCIVEYLADGSSKNIIRQYLVNPRGFEHERKIRMKYAFSFKERFRNAVHYVSSAIILKNRKFIADSPKKMLTIAAIPFGVALYFYISKTKRSGWKT